LMFLEQKLDLREGGTNTESLFFKTLFNLVTSIKKSYILSTEVFS